MNKILNFLPFQYKKSKQPVNNDTKLLFPGLPFCRRGMISRVEETPTGYIKTLYNDDGTENSLKMFVPKKGGKNYQAILSEYLRDARICQEQLELKYKEYSSNKYKPNLTKIQFIALAITTLLATLASLPLIFTTAWVGLALSTISSLLFYMVLEVHNKDKKNIKLHTKVIDDYKALEKIITHYSSNVNNPKGIEQHLEEKSRIPQNTYIPFIDLSIRKLLTKDNSKGKAA